MAAVAGFLFSFLTAALVVDAGSRLGLDVSLSLLGVVALE